MTNTDMFCVRYLNAMNNKLKNYGRKFYINFIFNTHTICVVRHVLIWITM